jgi:pantoate--beta-alanine ligase
MDILETTPRTREFVAAARANGRKIAFVPTMGALHAGHLSLVAQARELVGKGGKVIVSIFVNPLQFGPKEDFGRYPRPLEDDLEQCRKAGVDAVFHPSVEEMYALDRSTFVEETLLSLGMCGGSRPGHFRGVTTVVLKLFNIVQADLAVFGRKDYQQLAVIRRMVRDLSVPIRIVAGETVREPDGLALSSRNRYLNAEERAQALALSRALRTGADLVARAAREGQPVTREQVERAMREELATAPLARLDYLEVADADTLQPVERPVPGNVVLGAAFFGQTRLIDNLTIG